MRQPRLRHNDYTVLDVPRLGEWEPQLGVSVVIPAYGRQDKLDLALASLAAQSYPDRLLEVVVVDDGSSPPIRLPELVPTNTRLVLSPADGWGSAHAVNAGAAAASHDVILRLDADMVAYREHVEAHMRWHHFADYLTVLGSVAFTEHDAAGPAPVDVLDAVANGKAAELFDLEKARTSWVETVYEATDNLLRAGNRAFRVATGATISFSRRLYDESGGLDASMALESDTEFGYRLAQVGAVFVPDREARSWHLGLSQMKSRTEEYRRFRAPFIGQRVPLLEDHRREQGRQWSIPHVDVVVDAADSSFEDVAGTVVGALTGSFIDVGVTIVGPWGELSDERRSVLDDPFVDLRLVREAFAGDGRVRFGESVPATSFPAPFRFRCPAGLVLSPDGLRRLIEETDQRLDGLVLLPVRTGMLPIARLERTEALARAHALKDDDEDLEDVVHELFGVRWISGGEWALVRASDAPKQVTMQDLLADADKWKRIAYTRRTALEKAKQDAASWKKVAQVSLEARLKQAVKRRVATALRLSG